MTLQFFLRKLISFDSEQLWTSTHQITCKSRISLFAIKSHLICCSYFLHCFNSRKLSIMNIFLKIFYRNVEETRYASIKKSYHILNNSDNVKFQSIVDFIFTIFQKVLRSAQQNDVQLEKNSEIESDKKNSRISMTL